MHFQPGQEWHRRGIMPSCEVTLVRTLLPNPKNTQYMGHLWEEHFEEDLIHFLDHLIGMILIFLGFLSM